MNTLYDFADAMLATLTPYHGAADATYRLSYCLPPVSEAVLRLTARNILFELQLSREERAFAYAVIDNACAQMLKKESEVHFPGEKDLHRGQDVRPQEH